MPSGTKNPKIESFTQTEKNPLVDFLSQYSLSKIHMYSQSGQSYTDKEILFLSKKKYKGRPRRFPPLFEKEMMSFEDKNLFLAMLFDQCIDLVTPSVLALRSHQRPAIAIVQQKGTALNDGFFSEPFFHTVSEKFTVPLFKEFIPCFRNHSFRGSHCLAGLPNDIRALIDKSLIRFKYNSGMKWPSSIYITLLFYFVRKIIDQKVLQPCTNIDFINLLVFTSKVEVSIFTVFAFGFYVMSLLLNDLQAEFLFYYCAFCLQQARASHPGHRGADGGITITFRTEYDLEISIPKKQESASEFINEFSADFRSRLCLFVGLVTNENPGVSVDRSMLQEFVDSVNIKEFLLLSAKVFQIN
jgi:hypothetical protein